MNKKTIGALMICLGLVLGAALTTVSVSADGGKGPQPRVCTHPWCWQI